MQAFLFVVVRRTVRLKGQRTVKPASSSTGSTEDTSTPVTVARGGPVRQNSSTAPTASQLPWTSTSTDPSGRLATHPVAPAC